MNGTALDLAEGFRLSGLTHQQLWIRYLALGGFQTMQELRDHLTDPSDRLTVHEHNIIAQALNDAFVDAGGDRPVFYRRLYRRGAQ